MSFKHFIDEEDYMLGRSHRESARLYVQHWMWNNRIGYVLHPSIPTAKPNMRILDVGSGNACWLLELSRLSPPKWQLDGIDISAVNFPAPEYLPHNLRLRISDVFAEEVEEEMIEAFDVVHIRAFALVVRAGNPDRLIRNVVKMCKPGGYIQWEDMDCASFKSHAPNAQTPNDNSAESLRLWKAFAKKTDLDFKYLSALPTHFQAANLEVIASARWPPTNLIRKASSDNFISALEEIASISADKKGKSYMEEEEGGHKAFRELFRKVVEELKAGATLELDMVGIVGRKKGGC